MIFITTGSRSFQFNRLLKAVDEAVELGLIKDVIFAQVGNSDYKIKNYKWADYLDHDVFNSRLYACDIVITHGGTGAIVNSVKLGKKVIAVPRMAKYGEVVDDHQVQLIEAFSRLDMVIPCMDCTPETIAKAVEIAMEKEVKPYCSNTYAIINSIEEFIDGN